MPSVEAGVLSKCRLGLKCGRGLTECQVGTASASPFTVVLSLVWVVEHRQVCTCVCVFIVCVTVHVVCLCLCVCYGVCVSVGLYVWDVVCV